MMNKLFTLLFFFVVTASAAWGQAEPANYAITINKFKKFYNNNQPDSIYKMFGSEMRTSVPIDQFKATTATLQTQLGSLVKTELTSFNAPVAGYTATFQKAALLLSLSLNSQQQIIGLLLSPISATATKAETGVPIDPSLIESPVFLKTLGGTIAGTLAMPKNVTGKIPVVVIIAGAGTTDRDGNNPKLGINGFSYKLLASELGKNGIASLRYDKRRVGQSSASGKESDLHFDDYADDATSLVIMLAEDQRFSKIVMLGHGEGALAGMMASAGEPVSGFISISGAGESADKTLTEQMKTEPGYKVDNFKMIMDSMRKGKTIDKVDPSLYYLMRPSIQPFLMSWFRRDPLRSIKSLKIPVLIIQGTTDLQASVNDAEKLKKAKSDATLTIIPGMNYIFKEAPADRAQNTATYARPDIPIKPELVTAVVSFVNKVKPVSP